MARSLSLLDFALLACHFEILGEAAERAVEAEASAEAEVVDEPVAKRDTGLSDVQEDGRVVEDDVVDDVVEDDALGAMLIGVSGANIRCTATEENDEFILIMRTEIADPTSPYRLEVVSGSRFEIPDPPVTANQAIATLAFVSYPYLRELVANVTGRSPYQRFVLPPLTKLPHPRVTGEEVQPDPQ